MKRIFGYRCTLCGKEYPRRKGGRELNLKSIEVE